MGGAPCSFRNQEVSWITFLCNMCQECCVLIEVGANFLWELNYCLLWQPAVLHGLKDEVSEGGGLQGLGSYGGYPVSGRFPWMFFVCLFCVIGLLVLCLRKVVRYPPHVHPPTHHPLIVTIASTPSYAIIISRNMTCACARAGRHSRWKRMRTAGAAVGSAQFYELSLELRHPWPWPLPLPLLLPYHDYATTTLLNKNFDFRCLRFVNIHCCPAVRTGGGFLARRAAVWHWGWPYIPQHQPKDPNIKSNQKPEGKHAPLWLDVSRS